MTAPAFERLSRPIQRALWDMGWGELRAIQVDAIHAILDSDQDLLISASTASGKTEAAFLPILSGIAEDRRKSVQAMYIGPLKALINDQFGRLERLCDRAELPVHRWHGDVGGNKKAQLVKAPGGVLLITPESLESLFLNRTGALPRVFEHLDFVVIDEIHAFVGQERGLQLRSLLHRLQSRINRDFRIVGLSATVGDPEVTCRWFGRNRAERVRIIEDSGTRRPVRLSLDTVVDGPTESAEAGAADEAVEQSGYGYVELARRLHRALPDRSNLVFCNRKSDVEDIADLLNKIDKQEGHTGRFLVHHGSLSKELREHTEREMQSKRPSTAVCSSTLELGIDIGNVAVVGQIGPPHSVSSLIQRLGRSGRRGDEASTMLLYVTLPRLTAKADLVDRLRLDLVQAIALTELMLEGWSEPPDLEQLDLSTLIHQVMAMLAESGGRRADDLFDRLVTRGAFGVTPTIFADLLRSMAKNDLIEQSPGGELILGLQGEQIVRHYSFYAVFATTEEFQVATKSHVVGSVSADYPPQQGDHMLLGGKRWRVVAVDIEALRILVKPSSGRKLAHFTGRGGMIHEKVHLRMRSVLSGPLMPRYLTDEAAQQLTEAQRIAAEVDLGTTKIISLSPTHCLVLLWAGTRCVETVKRYLRLQGFPISEDHGVGFEVGASEVELSEAFKNFVDNPPDPVKLTDPLVPQVLGKFGHFLNDSLVREAMQSRLIDIAGSVRTFSSI